MSNMKSAAAAIDALDSLDIGELRPPFTGTPPHAYSTWPVRKDDSDPTHPFKALPLLQHHVTDETPTTAAASLPTPNQELLSLHHPRALEDASATWPSSLHYPDIAPVSDTLLWGPSSSSPPYEAPGAPLLKDLDSFTEGTAMGSFDFSLPDSPDGMEPVEPARSFACSAEDPMLFVETWRDDVIMSTTCGNRDMEVAGDMRSRDAPRGLKRHLSSTFSDGECDEEEQARGRLHLPSSCRWSDGGPYTDYPSERWCASVPPHRQGENGDARAQRCSSAPPFIL